MSTSSRGRRSMDMLSEASKEVRSSARRGSGGPSAPARSRGQKSVTPPDQRRKTRPANNRYASGGSTGGGTRGAVGKGPLQLYAKQIDSLMEMGFANTIASAQALEAAGGDMQRAIEFLTGKCGVVVVYLFQWFLRFSILYVRLRCYVFISVVVYLF